MFSSNLLKFIHQQNVCHKIVTSHKKVQVSEVIEQAGVNIEYSKTEKHQYNVNRWFWIEVHEMTLFYITFVNHIGYMDTKNDMHYICMQISVYIIRKQVLHCNMFSRVTCSKDSQCYMYYWSSNKTNQFRRWTFRQYSANETFWYQSKWRDSHIYVRCWIFFSSQHHRRTIYLKRYKTCQFLALIMILLQDSHNHASYIQTTSKFVSPVYNFNNTVVHIHHH